MNNTGEDFPIEDDNAILQINSPRVSVGGPYAVVYKDINERWAIVALDWDDQPRLGIRWFWGSGGNPFSSGNGTWLVVPSSLSRSMLSGLPVDHSFAGRIDAFLRGTLPGDQING